MSESPTVELIDVKVWKNRRLILDVPALNLPAGETFSVIGPNGAGKTTLLRIISLLDRPQSGQVFHDGEMINSGRDTLKRRRQLAMVMQNPLLRNASVWENVLTGHRFRHTPREVASNKVGEWLERLGISHLADRNARRLSGGEAQRVNMARGLVLEPDMLLLDEPFNGLDQPTRLGLMDDLWQILQEIQTTTVLVTHDRAEAQALSSRVAVMLDGKVEQIGDPEAVFTAPDTEEIANFVGVENILAGEVIESGDGLTTAAVGEGVITLDGQYLPGEELLLGISPEAVVIEDPSGLGSTASVRNRISGVVSRVFEMGAQARVVVDCGFPLVSLISGGSAEDLRLSPGVQVVASFKASAVHVIRNGEASESTTDRP
ncbi:MAG TPA: ABC transporter ATP-binding protein [Dehalococcoidia bacterium]|jgi:tungstate transport system ATP-binding protein|nr:molybdenum ABC transporter ATP-binding protein [Chloroflexota bacterium]MDP5876372.1 ABC transporter ATP-binding protein [Dehalococcoidia bacterium]MDP7161488.1 ABC transporter ATP-binding protein [Dehalococcoidia bacterium]MDP7212528.1 ABC transporter ATP-binding protein [Dehalococcoidia bacterium]MDP7514293.1 ABC transporter ATP-binding protein [Dehalococcoidia bacterium]